MFVDKLQKRSFRIPRSWFFLPLLWLAGCTVLNPVFESPVVSVTAVKVIPSQSINPLFEIELHIINPNRFALALQGLSYSVSVEGHKLLTGVASDLPEVAAYGEADVTLQARADFFSGVRLLGDLLKNRRNGLKYQLQAKLDVGDYIPVISVEETGDLLFPRR